jgi:integrase
MSFGTLIDIVRSSGKPRPSTRRAYLRAVSAFVSFAAGRPLTGALLEAWRDHRLSDVKHPVTAVTVYKDMSAVRFSSRRAFALGLIPVDFASGAEMPPRPAWVPKAALTAQEAMRLLAVCSADRSVRGARDLAIIVIIMCVCGARRAEVASLLVGSYRDGRLSIARKGGWLQQGIVLDPQARAAVEAWLAVRGGRGTDPMFVSLRRTLTDQYELGGGLGASGVAHIVVERAEEAGIAGEVRPHRLRHAFVSLGLAAGIPQHRMSVAAGHKSAQSIGRYIADVQADESPVGGAIRAFIHTGESR